MEAAKNLVAARLVIAHVDGKRVQFVAGDPIPAGLLSPHDEAQLKRMGAVRDITAEEAAEAEAEAATQAASAMFQQARAAVISERESVNPAAPEPADVATETAPDAAAPEAAAPVSKPKTKAK